jgi:hypothetical protein
MFVRKHTRAVTAPRCPIHGRYIKELFMKNLLTFLILLFSIQSFAGTGSQCTGKVIRVMDHTQQCEGKMAYLTDNSNGKWFCAPTGNGSSIVLSALMSGKTVASVFDSAVSTQACNTLTAHYIKPVYLLIHQ